MKLLTPILNDELLNVGPHLTHSEKYNTKINLGKLPLRSILKKNNLRLTCGLTEQKWSES